MPQIKVKNISTVVILGRQPGAEFFLWTDASGTPFGNVDQLGRNVDVFWQQRFEEDVKFNGDKPALQIIAEPPAPVASDQPPATPAKSKTANNS